MTPAKLAGLHARCFTTPRPWSADEFRSLLSDTHTLLVGGADGFALGRVIVDEAELLTIAVAPERRREGRGQRLLSDLEQAVRAHGATTCFLEVAADNSAAVALYHAAGYRETGRRRGYYRQPGGAAQDALILSRPLLVP
ncbi:MAG: ribosomal protein S18-alanine N-acetyltransferase [Paracoccaceae bacterium]